MRRFGALAAGVVVLALIAAAPAAAIEQPSGAIKNVELVGSVPENTEATALNFLQYGHGRRERDVMFAVGRFGLRAYDLDDPANPRFLDELASDPDLKLAGDTTGTFWQNEDMDVDRRRKLVFLSRDPRAYDGTTSDPNDVAGVYIVDARDPENLQLITFKELPTGHTTTCVNGCDFLWTGGPASNTDQQAEWPGGRPIIVTDLRDPANPVSSRMAVDLFRNDGVTAYSHDVQVDARGIAWVSGLGGTRGYWTRGVHYDPLDGRRRVATATDPIPFAGGAFDESAAPTKFMHNSQRPVGRTLRDGPRPGHGERPGSLIMATEEQFSSTTCEGTGQFTIASLEGSYGGEGWFSTPSNPFRMRTVGTWSVFEKEGQDLDVPFCSAHYFEMQDGIVAYAWYGNGTRFLDITDPTEPRQIAYYRPDGTNVWAPYFHRGFIYTADHGRGVEILKLTEGAAKASRSDRELLAPDPSARHLRLLADMARDYQPDPDIGWICPLPR